MSKAEQRKQRAIVKYIKLAYPNTLFTATMGGVKLNSWSQRNALKATGYLKGVADLLIFESKESYKGLFIEVKTDKGRMTTEQKQFQTNALARGYLCICCKGFDETKNIIDEYLK